MVVAQRWGGTWHGEKSVVAEEGREGWRGVLALLKKEGSRTQLPSPQENRKCHGHGDHAWPENGMQFSRRRRIGGGEVHLTTERKGWRGGARNGERPLATVEDAGRLPPAPLALRTGSALTCFSTGSNLQKLGSRASRNRRFGLEKRTLLLPVAPSQAFPYRRKSVCCTPPYIPFATNQLISRTRRNCALDAQVMLVGDLLVTVDAFNCTTPMLP